MSTFKEIIERVDEYKPNAFTTRVKLSWLTALDGKIAADVFLMGIEEVRNLPHNYPEALNCEPLVGHPHEDLYDLWLEAKIDYANGEYDKYQNTMAHYNEFYGNFTHWFLNTYEPSRGCQTDGFVKRPGIAVYYITAYGLAVKQGYDGTLEEWLLSLVGPKGDTGKSAYEYAREGGYAGTEEEYSALLQQGKSAYNYAVEGGYGGTEEEFRAKLAEDHAPANHDHDTRYPTMEEAKALLRAYALADHDHDGRYHTQTAITELLKGYALAGHDHNELYYTAIEMARILEGYASGDHGHTAEQVGALSSTGGTVSGPLTVAGNFTLDGGFFVGKVGVNIGTEEQRPADPPEGTVYFRFV